MLKRILLTGASGFTGRALGRALTAAGHQLISLSSSESADAPGQQLCCDLTDRAALQAALAPLEFDAVIHLAAISFVASEDAAAFYRTNVLGTCNLLEAIIDSGHRPGQVIVASSANVYGVPADASPLAEGAPLAPVSHYGCSKLAMEHMCRTYAAELPITITRPFNYTGPGQARHFLVPKLVDHFRRCAPLIELGNLDISRDFTSIDDMVAAYLAILDSGIGGQTFNISSGQLVPLRSIIDQLEQLTGHRIEVRSNHQFQRSNDILALCGDARRLQQQTGWRPRHSIQDMLQTMLASTEC